MTSAVIYARFSPRPKAEECDSVEKQLERCQSYCKGHGYDVVAEHFDKDLSGERADNRPGLQRAVEKACKRKAVLVVYKLDRLARNTRDCLDLVERLTRAGADLASITETINTRGPVGKFFITILAACDTLMRELIAARTSFAMVHHQANGRRMTRADRCPYGWAPDPTDPTRLLPDEKEQGTMVLIRQQHEQGRGFREIARWLQKNGIDCRGHTWHHSAIAAILRRSEQPAPIEQSRSGPGLAS